jgi:hypothetical protein
VQILEGDALLFDPHDQVIPLGPNHQILRRDVRELQGIAAGIS